MALAVPQQSVHFFKGPILPELTLVLLFIGLVLAVVTVVGHGIWVLLSAIFGSRSTSAGSTTKDDERLLAAFENRPLAGKTALDGLRRQLDSFAMRGIISQETRQRLAAAVDEEEQRLAAEAVASKAVAAAPAATEAASITSAATAETDGGVVLTPIEAAQVSPPSAGHKEPKPHVAAAASKEPGPPSTPGERARKYAASRAAASNVEQQQVAAASAAPASPLEPAVPMSRLFAAFMEENNIRWGELVGGLLIVGCSVALVISLWSQIAGRPLLQFVLFNGVTAALFGVGVYTDRRWKIHTTSRGVLVIATLLVPLNFLALAAFTQESPPTDLVPLVGEVISLAVFAFLVYVAGRILMTRDAVLLVVGVMVPCLMQLVVRRFAGPGMSIAALYGLAGTSVAAYLISACAAIGKRWSFEGIAGTSAAHNLGDTALAEPVEPAVAQGGAAREMLSALDVTDANRVLMFLGMVSAAVIMPLALLLYFTPPMRTTLHWLSPLIAVLGLPSLLVGLLFWRRITDKAHSGLQTAGIGVGVLGALFMAAAIVLAWPDPAMLLPTALLTAAAMLGVALWFGIPAAHVPAALAITAAAVVGFYVARGDVGWIANNGIALRTAVLSGTTGYVLLPLAAAFACIAWCLRRTDRAESSFMYGLVTAAVTITSLGLALWFGFARDGDPQNIVWLLFIYAIGALTSGVVLRRADAAAAGSAILLAALVQLIVFRYGSVWQLEQPRIVALLAHASIMTISCAVLVLNAAHVVRLSSAMAAAKFGEVVLALRWAALVTSVAAAIWLLAVSGGTSATAMALLVAWVAVLWMVLAVLCNWPALFTLSQIAAVRAILYAVTAGVAAREWYAASAQPTLEPWFLQLVGLALAGYCFAFIILRWFVAQASSDADETVLENQSPSWVRLARRFLDTPWPAVDYVVEVGVVLLIVLLSTYAAAPGVALELSPTEVAGDRVVPPIERFEIPGVPHAHAGDRWGWMLLAAAAVTLCSGLWQQDRVRWRAIGLAILAMAMCPMLAFQWETDMAVASALRWISAGLFAVASISLWFMRRIRVPPADTVLNDAAFNGALADLSTMPLWRLVRDLFVAFIVLVYVVMAVYVGSTALLRPDVPIVVQSIWPWVMGGALLAAAAALFVPNMVAETARASGDEHEPDRTNVRAWHARNVLLILAAAPIAVLFTFSVAPILDRYPIVGPEPATWFRRIGYDVSYGVPLAVIALTFVGHAVRDRSSGFAFAAGALLNVVATMVVLVQLAAGGRTLDAQSWILVGQVNAIVAGVVALLWQVAVAWGWRETQRPEQAAATESSPGHLLRATASDRRWPGLLVTQVVMAGALCAAFLTPSVVDLLFTFPPSAWAVAADGSRGWLAVLLAAVAGFIVRGRQKVSQNGVAPLVAALVALIALTAARNDTGNWLAYHTLLAGCCIAAWVLPLVTLASNRLIAGGQHDALASPLQWSSFAARCFGIAAVLLALRAYWSDPASPWWTIGGLAVIAARNLWITWHERSRASIWIAAALAMPAVSILWLDWGSQFSAATGVATACEFLWVNTIVVALLALFSVWIARREYARANSRDPNKSPTRDDLRSVHQGVRHSTIGFHRFAAWAIVAVLLLTTTAGLLADYFGQPLDASPLLAWAACIAGVVTALACSWDPAVRWSVACLYCIGLVAVGVYLDGLNLRAPLFEWALANTLSAYSLATSALWSVRGRLSRAFGQWTVSNETPDSAEKPTRVPSASSTAAATWAGDGHAWLVPANILLGVFVLLLVVAVELTVPSFTQRMVAAYAVGAHAFAIGLLAHGGVRTPLQYLALVWGVLFAIAFGWSFLPPDFPEPLLHRLIVTVAAMAVMVVAYGLGLVKFLRRQNEWTRAAAKLVPPLAVGTVATILTVLALEVTAFIERGQTQLAMPAIVLIAAALVVLILAALAAALLPGRDPLGLSERGRTAYVYAAEALGGLLFLHIRVTMPWLFRGWFTQFWPLVVMAIAFIGVGLGEVFQRRRQRVLAEPLHTSGVLLPLLPALGFWVVSSQVNYSLLLLSIGVLYAAMSMLRRSFLYGVLAAVAANGSLWYLFREREGLSFFDHPQLWLIPPALSALIAGYINRDRLTAQQSAALRYACAIVIYVSSTADIFINGVANAPWLPAVLAALSILGVLAGIWLRVRAFLYLGTAFLVVAILTIIWHAAIHQQRTYILWIAGIVTGALIIALFGLFEKRRDDVLRMVEELKHWHA